MMNQTDATTKIVVPEALKPHPELVAHTCPKDGRWKLPAAVSLLMFAVLASIGLRAAFVERGEAEARSTDLQSQLDCRAATTGSVNAAVLDGNLIILERIDRLGVENELLAQAFGAIATQNRDGILAALRDRAAYAADPRAAELHAEAVRLKDAYAELKARSQDVVERCRGDG